MEKDPRVVAPYVFIPGVVTVYLFPAMVFCEFYFLAFFAAALCARALNPEFVPVLSAADWILEAACEFILLFVIASPPFLLYIII